MKKEARGLLSLIIFIAGLSFFFDYTTGITGAVIGTAIEPSLNSFIGIILVIISGLLFVSGEDTSDDLEERLGKLFTSKPKSKKVTFVDYANIIGKELGHAVWSVPVEAVLGEIKKEFGSDNDLKDIIKKEFKNAGYFKAAYMQRDTHRKLEKGSPEYFADVFLQEWDSDYRAFVPQKNPYLIFNPKPKIERLNRKNIYDTRRILPLMEENIDGFKILDNPIGNHDVNVEYKGVIFEVYAGSKHPYEVPIKNIERALKRIAYEDAKKKEIKEQERVIRADILSEYIFED